MINFGQILQNRYQLKQKLGQNAGRQTWLAVDLQSNTSVIVKILAFNPQMQWDNLKLFEREAQVLKNINNPQIPKYYDYFSVDKQEGAGLPWFGLVQEYIPGTSLKQLLDQGNRFTEKQVRSIAIQVLKILINLHELSPPVLHRDIKPSNLVLGENNQIYLVDFGAAQDRAKAEGATFTVVGSNGYTPPEQLWGKAVPASDLYALGATLIHLLTGVSPSKLPQQRMRIQFKERVNVHPSFASWIEQLVQAAPERRFSTAYQSLSALQATLSLSDKKENSSEAVSRSPNYLFGCLLLLLLSFYPVFSTVLYNKFGTRHYRAQQSEARQYILTMHRAQSAYLFEHGTFSNSIEEVGLLSQSENDFEIETEKYSYSMRATDKAAFGYGIPHKKTFWQKLWGEREFKSYVGGIFLGKTAEGEGTTFSILCEADKPGTTKPAEPTYQNGVLSCGEGTRDTEIVK